MEKFTFIEWIKSNKLLAAFGLLATIGVVYAISSYLTNTVPAPVAIQSDTEEKPTKPEPERGNLENPVKKTDVIIGRKKQIGTVGKMTENKNQYL